MSEFHTTEQESSLNQLYKTRTRGNGTFLLIILARRPFNKTLLNACWGLATGYQPRPQVVDRGTTARYGGQLRYI